MFHNDRSHPSLVNDGDLQKNIPTHYPVAGRLDSMCLDTSPDLFAVHYLVLPSLWSVAS